MIPVASPRFVQQQNIQTIKDAKEAPLLHTSSRPTAWHDYLEQVGFEGRPYLTGRYFDQFSMVIALFRHRLELGCCLRYLVEKRFPKASSLRSMRMNW